MHRLLFALSLLAVWQTAPLSAQAPAAGVARLTVGPILMIDELPASSASTSIQGAWVEREGAIRLSVRGNRGWRLAVTGGDGAGGRVQVRARVLGRAASASPEYVTLGSAPVDVATVDGRGSTIVELDVRARGGAPLPTGLRYVLLPLD